MSIGRPIGKPLMVEEESETEEFSPRPLKLKGEDISRLRSLVSAPIKGIIKSTKEISEYSDPMKLALKMVLGPKEDFFEEQLEKGLPTKEGFAERALERGGRIAPYIATGPGGIVRGLIQAGLGGVGGEIGKEVGGSVGEFFGELTWMSLPGLGKKIIAKEGQQKLLDFARRYGLSEKEIAPLIQGQGKQKFLSKIAEKGKRVQQILDVAKKAAGNIFNKLRSSPEAQKPISRALEEQFLNKVLPIIDELPIELQKKAQRELRRLMKKPLTPKSLMGFNKNINYYQRQGGNEMGRLQGPILETLESLPGTLGQDFKMANQLYKQGAQLRKSLRPPPGISPWKVYKWGKIALGIGLHSFPLLAETMGEVAARKLATKLLTSPRFQNLSKQMVEALNNGKIQVAKRLVDEMQEMLNQKEDHPRKKETEEKE